MKQPGFSPAKIKRVSSWMEAVPREQPEKASEWKWTRESGQVEEEHRLLPGLM